MLGRVTDLARLKISKSAMTNVKNANPLSRFINFIENSIDMTAFAKVEAADLAVGIDWGTVPAPRTFIAGLKLDF